MACCRVLSVYPSICASDARAKAGAAIGKNLQKEDIKKPQFLIKALDSLPVSSLFIGLVGEFCQR